MFKPPGETLEQAPRALRVARRVSLIPPLPFQNFVHAPPSPAPITASYSAPRTMGGVGQLVEK